MSDKRGPPLAVVAATAACAGVTVAALALRDWFSVLAGVIVTLVLGLPLIRWGLGRLGRAAEAWPALSLSRAQRTAGWSFVVGLPIAIWALVFREWMILGLLAAASLGNGLWVIGIVRSEGWSGDKVRGS